MDARKHPTPGGLAIETSGFHRHLNESTLVWASDFNAAHRPQRCSARNDFSSTFGSPRGNSSHPWSVTTITSDQPALSNATIRLTTSATSVSTLRASFQPSLWPRLSSAPASVHADPDGSPVSPEPRNCQPQIDQSMQTGLSYCLAVFAAFFVVFTPREQNGSTACGADI
jgi:hypothetical protein